MQISFFDLPKKLQTGILSFSNKTTYTNCSRVSSQFNSLNKDPEVLKKLAETLFHTEINQKDEKQITYLLHIVG